MSNDFLNRYAKLPNLPVPKLNQTINTYLRTVKPLVTPEEYAATQKVARDFAATGSVGEKLQQMLEEKGAREANWVCFSHFHTFRIPGSLFFRVS